MPTASFAPLCQLSISGSLLLLPLYSLPCLVVAVAVVGFRSDDLVVLAEEEMGVLRNWVLHATALCLSPWDP